MHSTKNHPALGRARPLRQIAVRAEHAGADRECRNQERHPMQARRQRKCALLLAPRVGSEQAIDPQRLQHEKHQHKQNPQRQHQVQPPECRRLEALPGCQPPQHVKAREAGQRD